MTTTPTSIFRKVDFLEPLDDATLEELVRSSRTVRYAPGDRVVSELEAGADVYVVLDGEAEVFVEPRAGEKQVLGKLAAGRAFGEMSSLTGELRSATVVAKTKLEALVIPDDFFDRLRERRPEVAVALVRTLANRLADADRSVEALMSTKPKTALKKTATRGSIGRVWKELVVGHRRELPFLTLVAFVATLVAVRLAVFASFHWDLAPRIVLRTAYMSGFTLLIVSAAASLLTYRPSWRKIVAIAYGIGGALIFNELGVTLAFDIYFRDIHTPDPNVAFDVEHLYRRTEPMRAIAIGIVVLVQAVYLRRFYQRVWFIAKTRMRKAFAR